MSLRASARQALSGRAAGASCQGGSGGQQAPSSAGRTEQGGVREALGLRNHMFRSLHPVSIAKLEFTGQPV